MTEAEAKPAPGAVRAVARVVASDCYAGTVRQLLVGDAVAASRPHARTGGLFGKDRCVAAYDVRRVTPETVRPETTRHAAVETAGRAGVGAGGPLV